MRRVTAAMSSAAIATSMLLLVAGCGASTSAATDQGVPAATTGNGPADGDTAQPKALLTDDQIEVALDVVDAYDTVNRLVDDGGGSISAVMPWSQGGDLEIVGAVVEIRFEDGPVTIPAGTPTWFGNGEGNGVPSNIAPRPEPEPGVNVLLVVVDLETESVHAVLPSLGFESGERPSGERRLASRWAASSSGRAGDF